MPSFSTLSDGVSLKWSWGLGDFELTMASAGGADMYHSFYRTAVGNLILVLAGAVPGYWVSAALIDTIGRKPIQLFGFFALVSQV